jgi:lipopolysaccharide export system permease protein
LGLWVPLVLLSGLILWMYHVLAHKPGGQPIGALEWFFAVIAKRIRSLVPKPRAA